MNARKARACLRSTSDSCCSRACLRSTSDSCCSCSSTNCHKAPNHHHHVTNHATHDHVHARTSITAQKGSSDISGRQLFSTTILATTLEHACEHQTWCGMIRLHFTITPPIPPTHNNTYEVSPVSRSSCIPGAWRQRSRGCGQANHVRGEW